MATRRNSRQTARHRRSQSHSQATKSLSHFQYRRKLRYEPLEDRRLLATVTVTTALDTVDFSDGLISLREAIFATNLVGGTDTIDFAPALIENGPATILLTMGELAITDDISILGLGPELLTIDAQRESRIFNITATTGDYLVSGLTLTRGLTSSDNASATDTTFSGGAIRSASLGLLSIDSCVISVSETLGNRTNGGGVFATGDLVVTGSTIIGNRTTASGGGVYSRANTTLADSEFNRNFVARTSFSGVSGGGGAFSYGSLTVDRCVFEQNDASFSVGGGMASYGALVLSDSQIRGNIAQGAGGVFGINVTVNRSTIDGNSTRTWGAGGGILVEGSLTLNFSTISNNTAGAGGGGGVGVGSLGSKITMNESAVIGNAASGDGGGINASWLGTIVTLNQSTVSDNTASGSGGGVFTERAVVNESTVSNNVAAVDGGGIQSSDVRITRSTIAGNSVTGAGSKGGGLSALVVDVEQSTISGNSSSGNGGGIASGFGPFVKSSTISGNTAAVLGGGIYAGFPDIRHSTITDNTAGVAGGGVFFTNRLNLDHAIVAANTSPRGRDFTAFIGTRVEAHFTLIGSNADTGLIPAPIGSPDANGNLIGGRSSSSIIDPELGPLANNGGPTVTHALLPGSPAINAGDPAAIAGVGGVPEFDQRGEPFDRVAIGRLDMGAFELQPVPLVGDYNGDGSVDAADYVVWRKFLSTSNDMADGDGSGVVDQPDREIWQENFGRSFQDDAWSALETAYAPVSGTASKSIGASKQASVRRAVAKDAHVMLIDSLAPRVKRDARVESMEDHVRVGRDDRDHRALDEALPSLVRRLRTLDAVFAALGAGASAT